MAFPLTKLPITVELQINGTWVDISGDVRTQGGTDAIAIGRGIKASGGKLADAATCAMTLDNNSGAYSDRNPLSPYYPYLGLNTPLRVGVAFGTPWLDCPHGVANTAVTPDASVLDIVGDLDVRVDAELAVWGEGVGDGLGLAELIGKYNVTGSQRSWRLVINTSGQIDLTWSPDGTAALTAQSVAVGATPNARLSVRATLDVNNGAGGWTATFYTSATAGTAGPWTQLGTPVTGTGTTAIFNSTATLNVGDIPNLAFDNPARKIFAAEVRSGIAGTVVANPNFETQTVGATSFADTAPSARTWTVTAKAITNVYRRFVGEANEWPPQWDTGGKDVTTPIQASGALQRYTQSKAVLQSALRHSIPSEGALIAYWPMEDGATATQAASPTAGVAPMRTSGFTFAADSTLAGSGPLPQIGAPATMTAAVPAAPAGDWTVACMFNLATLPAAPELMLRVGLSGGTAAAVQFLVGVGVARIQALDSTGAVISTFDSTATAFTSGWARLQISTTTLSGTVNLSAQWTISGTIATFTAPTSFSGTPGRVASLSGSWGSDFGSLRLGHMSVIAAATTTVYSGPDLGWVGETALSRAARIAIEQGVEMSVIGDKTISDKSGPQPIDTFLNTVSSAVQATEGLLYEAREFLGLRARGVDSLYGQPSALDLPYVATPQALVAPLTPAGDLQDRVNDSTVTRTNGSSYRSVIATGRLSVQDPPLGIGTGYDEDVTLNLATDDQPAQHASWRTFIGTFEADRFPQVNISLEKNPALIPAACRIDTGSRMRITPPLLKQLPPDTIDQLVLGYSENISQFSWRIQPACQPYGPYGAVGAYDDGTSHYDSPGCALASPGLTTTATSANVTSTSVADRWADSATYASDFPFDMIIGGERCTVTAITGTTASQTMTLTRAVNGIVKSHLAGEVVALADPRYYGL